VVRGAGAARAAFSRPLYAIDPGAGSAVSLDDALCLADSREFRLTLFHVVPRGSRSAADGRSTREVPAAGGAGA
jgi:hypothetical protein